MNTALSNFQAQLALLPSSTKIIAAAVLGSQKGIERIDISDIDIFILCQCKNDCNQIFSDVSNLCNEIFLTQPRGVNRWVQKNALASLNYAGIHLIVIGRDELTDDWFPRSFRLKLLTFLIGRNTFLLDLKKNKVLLIGKDESAQIRLGTPSQRERIGCFLFPALILLAVSPIVLFIQQLAIIWICKAIKYHVINLENVLELANDDRSIDKDAMKLAKEYRYQPEMYKQHALHLYLLAWQSLWKNRNLSIRRAE